MGDGYRLWQSSRGRPGDDGGSDGRRPQRDLLLDLAQPLELWCTEDSQPYATLPVAEHQENWPISSKLVRAWLVDAYDRTYQRAPGSQALQEALATLEARARRGQRHRVWLRVAAQGDVIYVDLGDLDWRAVRVDATGWTVVPQPPVKFVRSRSTRALPAPVDSDEGIGLLRPFLNIATDADFHLMAGCLISWFRPNGPHFIVALAGEQGTGKTMIAELLKALIDPTAAPLRSLPKDDRDLFVSAGHSWVLGYDNVSTISASVSDALCRLASGGGFSTRSLYTDDDEVVLEAERPVVLTGIPDLATRPDLADRTVAITLKPLPPGTRRTEREFWAEFAEKRPAILGALLDGVAAALRNLDRIAPDPDVRMADAAHWITAAESGLGWEPGTFLAAYRERRKEATEITLDADPVAVALLDLMEARSSWEGTATALLAVLTPLASEQIRKGRLWPVAPNKLSERIRRLAPSLRQKGIEVDTNHRAPDRSRRRLIQITFNRP